MRLLLQSETVCRLPHLAGEQGGGGAGAGQWGQSHLQQGGRQLEQAGEDRGVTEPISPAIKGLTRYTLQSGKLTSRIIKHQLPSGIPDINQLRAR